MRNPVTQSFITISKYYVAYITVHAILLHPWQHSRLVSPSITGNIMNTLHHDFMMATASLGNRNFTAPIMILWDHHHTCSVLLMEKSLCATSVQDLQIQNSAGWSGSHLQSQHFGRLRLLLSAGKGRLPWAKIVPLHSSLGDRARLGNNNNKKVEH